MSPQLAELELNPLLGWLGCVLCSWQHATVASLGLPTASLVLCPLSLTLSEHSLYGVQAGNQNLCNKSNTRGWRLLRSQFRDSLSWEGCGAVVLNLPTVPHVVVTPDHKLCSFYYYYEL